MHWGYVINALEGTVYSALWDIMGVLGDIMICVLGCHDLCGKMSSFVCVCVCVGGGGGGISRVN